MQSTNTNTTKPLKLPARDKQLSKPPPKSPIPPTPSPLNVQQVLDFGFPVPPATIPAVPSIKSARRRGREIHPIELSAIVQATKSGQGPLLRDSAVAEMRSTAHIKSSVGEVFAFVPTETETPQSFPRLSTSSSQDKLDNNEPTPTDSKTSAAEAQERKRPPVPGPWKRPTASKPIDVNKPLPQLISSPENVSPNITRFPATAMERDSSGSSTGDHSSISTVPRVQGKAVKFEEPSRPSGSASSSKFRLDGNSSSVSLVKKDVSDAISVSSKMSAREKFQLGGKSMAKSIKASFASLRAAANSQASSSTRTMSIADNAASITGLSTASSYGRQRVASQPLAPQFSTLPPFTRLNGEFDREAQFAYTKPKPLRLPKLPSRLRREPAPPKEPEIIFLDYDEMTHAVVTLNPYRLEFILPKSMREQMERDALNPPSQGFLKGMKSELKDIQKDVKKRLKSREPPLAPELGGQDGGFDMVMKVAAFEKAAASSQQPRSVAPVSTVIDISSAEDKLPLRKKRAQYFKGRTQSFPNLRQKPSFASATSSKRGLRQERGWAGVPMPSPPLNIDPENCTLVDVIESAIEAYLEKADSLDQPLVLPLIRPLVIPGKNAPKVALKAPTASSSQKSRESAALIVSQNELEKAADIARKRQSVRGSVFFDLDLDFSQFDQEQEASFLDIGTRDEAQKYVEYKARSRRPIDELNDDELEWMFRK